MRDTSAKDRRKGGRRCRRQEQTAEIGNDEIFHFPFLIFHFSFKKQREPNLEALSPANMTRRNSERVPATTLGFNEKWKMENRLSCTCRLPRPPAPASLFR